MRAVATVASCIGVGFVLQGCGGGNGGGDKVSCLADKMDVVSQKLSGTSQVSVTATKEGKTHKADVTGSFKESFDLEKFNMREEGSMTTQVEEDNVTMNVTQNTTTILNLAEKQIIMYMSVSMGNETKKHCEIQDLPPNTPEPEAAAQTFKLMVMPLLQSNAVCGGNDGTYDTWKFNKTYDGPLPQDPTSPIPGLDGLSIKGGAFNEEVQMTKDALLHSSVTHVKGEMLNGTDVLGSMDMQATMTVTDAQKGGPSASDLDPSKFDVNCTRVNTSVDLEVFLRSPGYARQQMLRVMEASKQSAEDTLMV